MMKLIIGLAGMAALSLVLSSGGQAMSKQSSCTDPQEPRGYRSCSAPPAPALVSIDGEPQPRLFADAPIPSHLAAGRVVIPYRVEHIRILPVFGEAALGVSPRIGHLHVTVDRGPWRWLDTSAQPIVVNLLPPGPHTILLELVDTTHRTVDKQLVSFVIPEKTGVPTK